MQHAALPWRLFAPGYKRPVVAGTGKTTHQSSHNPKTRSNMNPTDTKYQVSNDFKPDKEVRSLQHPFSHTLAQSTWTSPAEQNGWMLAHNALRGEISDIHKALLNMRTTESQVKALQQVWKIHYTCVHGHHTVEDSIYHPELSKRFKYPQECVDDHQTLVDKLHQVDGLVQKLQAKDSLDELTTEFEAYRDMLLPHLRQEEEEILPLVRAYFTSKELKPIIDQTLAFVPPVEMGSFLYRAGEDMIRNVFMKNEGIPWFVWHIDFSGKYALFERDFIGPVQALQAGQDYTPPVPSWRCEIM